MGALVGAVPDTTALDCGPLRPEDQLLSSACSWSREAFVSISRLPPRLAFWRGPRARAGGGREAQDRDRRGLFENLPREVPLDWSPRPARMLYPFPWADLVEPGQRLPDRPMLAA
jgi:hypothetical protein